MFGLEYLIAPRSVDEFRDRYWGEQALYIPGQSDKFDGLFGWDDVNHALNHGRCSFEGVRLVHDKKGLPHESLSNIDHWLTEGATLVINNVNQIDPVAEKFAALLGADLNTHININSYMSCPNKQGFDNHFDGHDVFIVHLEGKKAWKVYEPTIRRPLDRQTQDKGKPPETDPYLECEMNPGDVLYIPRGHWHYALAITPSIHLTVGQDPRTGSDFLRWLADRLMDNEEFFRKDFPVVGARELGGTQSNGAFTEHMEEFRRRMHEILDRDSLQEAFVHYCMQTNPLRRAFQLPHTWLVAEQMAPETSLMVPDKQKVLVDYDDDTEHAVIKLLGHVLHLNKVPKSVVAALFSEVGTPFNGQDILEKNKGVEWDQLKSTLVTLYQSGVLVLADNG